LKIVRDFPKGGSTSFLFWRITIMASVEEISERVRSIVAEQLGSAVDDVTPKASLIEDLGADSLDIVELVMALEEEYEMEIPDEEAEKIQTVEDIVTFIKNKKG
jgi:acyl carrier protein